MQTVTKEMAIFQAQGSLNASNAHDFHSSLVQKIQSDLADGLFVDMSQVESLDSAGLISLVSALKQARQLQKRLCLCSVPPAIRIVFELTQLDRAFEMVDELPAAA
ncbi:STAS domain-containing protein [Leptolyngbya sp. CCNP1308]|uniref:STAS domain-containing protein n=1 Tax=Leptolyngbya sp. CCNP1308 TaxID=3110255 RepID=UPI002B1ED11B|nr:STAS domain-containing protein [Leptolyngbya sp. CCNP1308]MEA5447796.1 STAS domain-containing protein [Leptolyngbya sp. CCNP1308]